MRTHVDVLNKLAGLDDEPSNSIEGEWSWASPYRLPKAPGSGDNGKLILAPASLTPVRCPHKTDSKLEAQPARVARATDDEHEDDEASQHLSQSCSSSYGSEDGSQDGSSEDDTGAGVFGISIRSTSNAHDHRKSGGGEPDDPAGAARKDFCLGIRWFIRNNKLVVGSFSGWSVADKMGVKHGDILRAVDGVEVLNMTADADGNHPAKRLLSGVYGSKCFLHLMRVDVGQVKDMMNRPGSSAGKEKLILHDVHVEIPRLIAADI